MTTRLRLLILWGKLRYHTSWVIPQRFTTEFTNHRGAPWRVHWWQWRDRIYHSGGQQIGPLNPAFAVPCSCHDTEGNRTSAHPEYGR